MSTRTTLTLPRPARIDRPRLPLRELLGCALQGLRIRRLRAALSGLGIAIGIGSIVAMVAVSASSQANLLAQIDALGTNLLTVSPEPMVLGANAVLPDTAVPMVGHVRNVLGDVAVYRVSGANVYRNPLVPSEQTGGIRVDAVGDGLPQVMGASIASGHFLDAVSDKYPEVVLGARAAQMLQITQADEHVLAYLGHTWFAVIGVLRSATLDAALDSAVFISLPVAQRIFGLQANPSEIYVRANQDDVNRVASLLAGTADPQDPSGIHVSRRSNALEARDAASGQFTTLLVVLGAVALLVGAIEIANTMVISVLERRGEIGLRRALGATRRHISAQFLAESAVLAMFGGIAGVILGAGATWIYAQAKNEPFVVPLYALIGAPAAGIAVGALAGLYPAAKAARLSPTEALRA